MKKDNERERFIIYEVIEHVVDVEAYCANDGFKAAMEKASLYGRTILGAYCESPSFSRRFGGLEPSDLPHAFDAYHADDSWIGERWDFFPDGKEKE